MNRYQFEEQWPDCTLEQTLPKRDKADLDVYIYNSLNPRGFQGPAVLLLDDKSKCIVANHPAKLPYERMPRYWRRKMFPSNFERWKAEEHAGKRVALTFEQQERVWMEMDAWEDFFDGKHSLEQARQIVADLGPLPKLSAKALVRKMTVRPKAERKGPSEEFLLAAVSPVPEPSNQPEGVQA